MGLIDTIILGVLSSLLVVTIALLVWLHRGLGQLQRSQSRSGVLAEEFTAKLIQAQRAMEGLGRDAREVAPGLKEEVELAYKARQELQYVLARAETVLKKLEELALTTKQAPKQEVFTLEARSHADQTVREEPIIGHVSSKAEQELKARLGKLV